MEQHSYRSTQLIVATAYDGVCYVMGADIYETRNCFFAGIKTDVIPSYGEKAYSNEWANGIWYGEDGFRTKSHPYKAQWKSDRQDKPCLLIGFDSEWENAIPAREMLSWQFALIDGEDLVEFIFF